MPALRIFSGAWAPVAPGDGHRLAYDPEKGRLWNVCPRCTRWILTPLDSRWETLEACEEVVGRVGQLRFSTDHLSLVTVGDGELIRVGGPPRKEFVGWRYGSFLKGRGRGDGFLNRLLAGLPAPPVGGYDPYKGFEGAVRSAPWLASPFLESASALTYLFSQVPLAPECPSCSRPLALWPWSFQAIGFVGVDNHPGIRTTCALCETEVALGLAECRPTLRLGLGLVTPGAALSEIASGVADDLDAMGGPPGFLKVLMDSSSTLETLSLPERAGLIMSLDELAEVEALEAEWKKAEEMAAIIDRELSDVTGFETFKKRIIDEGL